MAHSEGPPREGDRSSERPGKTRGPLISKFPGELALRDAAGAGELEARLCAARFAVLQLAERYANRGVDAVMLMIEIDSAIAYVTPVQDRGPADALRLRRVLDAMRVGEPRKVVSAVLAAGDTALAAGQVYAGAGFYNATYDLADRIGWNAAALTAASRLRDLAIRLQRPRAANRWQKRCAQRLSGCK
jgi:hypothetical protein